MTTVSETYAREILTDYYGYGLQRLLRSRGKQFIGILNGISYHDFNPSTDKLIRYNYDIETYQEGKQKNKVALQDLTGFEFPLDKPLLALVSRLVSQKGMISSNGFDEMLAIDDFILSFFGSGD